MRSAPDSILAVVASVRPRSSRRRPLAAIGATVAAHALLLGSAVAAADAHVDRSFARPAPDRVVELFDPPPPPPPPPTPAVVEPPPPPPVAKHVPVAAAPKPAAAVAPSPNEPPAPADAKPPPAQAGQVVAAEPDAAEPVDFASFDIATGNGASYAGGITSSSGTNRAAVRTRDVDPTAKPIAGGGARPVSLPAREWNCPWPRGASSLGARQVAVTLRAVVGADGRVESVEALDDPGNGFAEAALACARRARFEPARDDSGRAIHAVSPPIRVRFTR